MLFWAEALERRLLLHAHLEGSVLVMGQASPGALVDDTFIVSYDPTTFEVVMNHQGSLGHPGNRTSLALFSSIRIECGPGNDTVVIQGTGNRPITILCDTGNDNITIQNTDNNPATVEGGAGDDSIIGGNEPDVLRGGDGSDTLRGGGGNDTLDGDVFLFPPDPGAGDDWLFGDAGADTLRGGQGNDTSFGGAGNDYISETGGTNSMYGEDDADQLFGGPDPNYMSGGDGNDSLYGDDQSDTLVGGQGGDLLAGFGGEDWMYANEGTRDTVNGGDGNDWADVDSLDFIVDAEERIGAQAAYTGGPWFLPTTIQAENFDFGGEGVAYHDNDFNLVTSGFRGKTEVEFGTTFISFFPPVSFRHVIGDAGEWLEYTVDVPASGGYEIQTNVSSAGAGGTFHYELDGAVKTPTLTVPDTSRFFGYSTVTWGGINLPAGRHVLRLALDTNGATGHVGNFESINIIYEGRNGYPGGLAAIPGTVQAEDFDTGGEGIAFHDLTLENEGGAYRNTAVDVQANADGGAGFHAAFTKAGEWLEYGINVAHAGVYVLSARVASQGNGGNFHVNFNGVNKTGTITVPNTGAWTTWQTLTRTVTLTAGEQIMRLAMDANGALGYIGNINWISILPVPGDTNFDGAVGFADLLTLAKNYGQSNRTFEQGDFDGNGTVGFPDLLLLAKNYGTSVLPAAPAADLLGRDSARLVTKVPELALLPAPAKRAARTVPAPTR